MAKIRLEGVSLQVPIYVQRERHARSWTSMLFGAVFDPPVRRVSTLLNNVTFEARPGDRLAILGRNGAGKSTLLRVMNKVFTPTRGLVTVDGSRQALLNLSLGFNGEATVRENIFLRGTAMGLRAAELRDMIDSIVEFAGLQEKTNHRLRTLSSGQRMRLGFAISTAFQHDIILMDEWVGAGDADFMKKAKERMQGRMESSKIVVLASHSVGLLRDVCTTGLVLEAGRVVYHGEIGDALKEYNSVIARAPEPRMLSDGPADEQAPAVVETIGALERVEFSNGMLTVGGWALRNYERMPEVLALDINGTRTVVREYERLPRRDVQSHFGLLDATCGFRFSIPMELPVPLEELLGRAQLLGGDSESDLTGPFRIAPALLARANNKAS
jgi:lipopolysaccharide transport system ATP-binding protein